MRLGFPLGIYSSAAECFEGGDDETGGGRGGCTGEGGAGAAVAEDDVARMPLWCLWEQRSARVYEYEKKPSLAPPPSDLPKPQREGGVGGATECRTNRPWQTGKPAGRQ